MDRSESRLRSVVSEVRSSIGDPTAEAEESEEANDEENTTETAHTDVTSAGDETLPLDLAFEILKNGRRRMVLEELGVSGGEVTLGELSETIAARENDKTVAEISSKERKRVYVGLYQAHLPKMDDAGIVQFNKDRGLISPGPHADLLARFLGAPTRESALLLPTAAQPSSRWSERVVTTLLLGLLVGLSLWLGTLWGVSVSLLALVLLFGLSVLLTVVALTEA
jgi:hypothetical protein